MTSNAAFLLRQGRTFSVRVTASRVVSVVFKSLGEMRERVSGDSCAMVKRTLGIDFPYIRAFVAHYFRTFPEGYRQFESAPIMKVKQ
jgi:hypothetical protein